MPIPNLSLCGPSSCHVCCSLTCLSVILDIFKISFQRRLIFKIFFSRHLQTLKMIGSFWDLPSARTFIFHLAIYKTFGQRLLCCLWHRAGTPSLTWSSIHKGWETIRGQWNHVWLSFFFLCNLYALLHCLEGRKDEENTVYSSQCCLWLWLDSHLNQKLNPKSKTQGSKSRAVAYTLILPKARYHKFVSGIGSDNPIRKVIPQSWKTVFALIIKSLSGNVTMAVQHPWCENACRPILTSCLNP